MIVAAMVFKYIFYHSGDLFIAYRYELSFLLVFLNFIVKSCSLGI